MKVIIYETFQHIIPTGEGWASGLEALGHTVYRFPSHQYSLCEVDELIDIVIILSSTDPSRYEDIIRYKKTNPQTKICLLTLGYKSAYDTLKNSIDIWIETVMEHSHSIEEFKRKGLKLIFVPLAADDKRFFPTEDDKIYDVSFIGTMGKPGEREEDKYLYPVLKQSYRGMYSGFGKFPHVPHIVINKIYNQTKVNLNFHYPYQKGEVEGKPITRSDFNGRVYEVAMSGNFQMCDHPDIAEYFGHGIPYVPQDKWLEVLDYYLVHDDERNAMAAIARKTALKNHTWKKRMEEFLDKI
jgi:hypothetical protein